MDLNFNPSGVLIDPMPGSATDPMPGISTDPHPGSNTAEPGQSNPNGLVAQALNSHRAAITRASDNHARNVTRNHTADAIWRWASSIRVNAVAREVFNSLRFANDALWLAPSFNSHGLMAGPALQVLSLVPPGAARLDEQIQRVLDCADERPDRLPEILVQARDLWPFWTAVTHVVPGQAPRTTELMAVAQAVGGHIGHLFKHSLAVPRPADLSPSVQPCLTTPGHGAMPSGHAISAFTALRVFRALLPNSIKGGIDTVGIALDRTARRIASNRVVAGLHYPLDNNAGWCVAETGFEVLSVLGGRTGNLPGKREFNAETASVDGLPNSDVPLNDNTVGSTVTANPGNAVTSPLLKLLWDEAERELTRLQLN